ncbi:hypothetical protein RUM44_008792 [Polyplax serrata]|uniref:Uncharacterized protein n=1 Tax=Polyplax serrata TaxID=468196 RepID=A0ABR1B988_POLSC
MYGDFRSDHSNKNFHHNDTKHKRKGESLNEGKGAKVTKQNEDSTAPEQGKTLLEILELEMRARAIRALLKQSTPKELESDETKTDNKNSMKEIEGEVVDLTECKDDEFPVCVKKENSEQKDIDKKQSTFEQIIEKSKSEKKSLAKADDKSKRLQAELELRNKLFKKKIYRTRQQRMENEEEDKNNEAEAEVLKPGGEVNVDVVFKKEAIEPDEIVVEDPEEGEISTSEDEYPVVVKQEIIEPEIAEEPQELDMDYKSQIDENVERVTAIDNGTFVHNCNLENKQDLNSDDVIEVEQSEEPLTLNDDSQLTGQEHDEKSSDIQESKEMDKEEFENTVEETSWRDRWLKKDGVQKLVKSSKIYAKVKKRIAAKSQKAKEEVLVQSETVTDPKTVSPQIEVIEGSIKEYERLLGKVHEERKENEISENGNSNVLTS